jgi:hypothetical protein
MEHGSGSHEGILAISIIKQIKVLAKKAKWDNIHLQLRIFYAFSKINKSFYIGGQNKYISTYVIVTP